MLFFLDSEYSSYANPMEEDYVDKILAQHSINFQGYLYEMLYLIIVFCNTVFLDSKYSFYANPKDEGFVDRRLAQHRGNFIKAI